MNKTQSKRMLNVAKALRESPAPKQFSMYSVVHDFVDGPDPKGFCGTPACAIGHYAARGDLQKLMKVEVEFIKDEFHPKGGTTSARVIYTKDKTNDYGNDQIGIDDDLICEHFGITSSEACELFDGEGCGGATTPKGAAGYIERFVARKLKEQTQSAGKLVRRDDFDNDYI